MPQADITIQIPPVPAGFRGTLDDYSQFIVENGLFYIEGEFASGQIGGARPTQDVGIYYGPNSVEMFRDGKYRAITDVPVGCVLPWAGVAASAPENYLFCIGQSLIRTDYADLFEIIGATYGSESGTTFNVPDFRGRVATGAGVGDYVKQGLTGRMREVKAGEYSGFEWPRNLPKDAAAPKTTKIVENGSFGPSTANLTETFPSRIGMQFIIRYR